MVMFRHYATESGWRPFVQAPPGILVVHLGSNKCDIVSHSERVLTLVRPFTVWALQCNVLVHARHVLGVENRIADALARHQMYLFRELDPGAREFTKVLPLQVWQIGERIYQEQ